MQDAAFGAGSAAPTPYPPRETPVDNAALEGDDRVRVLTEDKCSRFWTPHVKPSTKQLARNQSSRPSGHGSVRPSGSDGHASGLLGSVVSGLQRLFQSDARPPAAGTNDISITLRNPWRAVRIVSSKDCCEACDRVDGIFLCAEAPRLPLKACTNPKGCRCKYRHLEDRRQGPRRHRDDEFRPPAIEHDFGAAERRRSRGRRVTD